MLGFINEVIVLGALVWFECGLVLPYTLPCFLNHGLLELPTANAQQTAKVLTQEQLENKSRFEETSHGLFDCLWDNLWLTNDLLKQIMT